MSEPKNIKVLVTGFGPFLDITINPSWEITRNLPKSIVSPNGTSVELIIPDSPIPAAYHKILAQATALAEKYKPHIIVHIGLAVDRDYFAVEQSALKEGYHDIPDIDRKVFTRGENKKTFGKAAHTLSTSLDLETAISKWQAACASMSMPMKGDEGSKKVKGKQRGRPVDVQLSDDVGTYVCGFIYYVSMSEMQKTKGTRDVVFLHVPRLQGEEEVGVGVEVVKECIVAMVGVWENK